MSTCVEIVDECIVLEIAEETLPTEIVLENPSVEVSIIDDTCEIVIEEVSEIVQDPDSFTILEDCKQGPTGPIGPQGPPGVGAAQTNHTVSVSTTSIIGSASNATINAAKWLVTVEDEINGLARRSELDGVKLASGADFSHSRFGDIIDYDICVVVNGGVLELEFTNNHTEALDVNAVRIETVEP